MSALAALGRLATDLRNFAARGKWRLALAVDDFLRDRVSVERARAEIKHALEKRQERFLALARGSIYGRPESPYLKLLDSAGCDYADLEALVRRHGLEAALERLAASGVYLTSDEFKGKQEVVRGARSFRVDPGDFERRSPAPGFATESSGTRNRPLRSVIRLDWLELRTFATAIFFDAHDLFSYSQAVYDSILPGSAINHLLVNAKLGQATERWFARRVPEPSRLHSAARYLGTCLILLAARRRIETPLPRFVDDADLSPIVRWIESEKRKGKNCYITTVASSAARIARAAYEMGVPLDGTKLNVAGEPFTQAKEEVLRRSGAGFTTRYSYGGNMSIGMGCAAPADRDEVHVNQHLFAIIRNPVSLEAAAPAIHPFLLTTLAAEAPRLLLNVANGDYGTISARDCGCALQSAGLRMHLHSIRSFEKLTTEGMNYYYGDLFELLERTIPCAFGGGPGDYQLVEEEDESGQTRLTLLVHPGVGAMDEAALLARLMEAFATGPWGRRFVGGVWRNAGAFRIRREVPHASRRGKVLPLHLPR